MKQPAKFGLALLLTFGVLAACEISTGDGGSEDGGSTDPAPNPPSTPGTPPAPTPPEDADISVSVAASATEGVAPLQVVFTATVSGTATDSSWYINDREIQVDGPRLTFTFRSAGEYLVTYSAANAQGEVANDAVTVVVTAEDTDTPEEGEPVITSFEASPEMFAPGESVTLSWAVTDATSLEIDQGVGTVTGTSTIVTPAATTTYTLTATNANGDDTETVTVALDEGDDSDPGPGNDAPTVLIAGETPRPATAGVEIDLDATAEDADDDELTFLWNVTSGTVGNVTLGSPTAEDTTAIFSEAGDYTLTLTVTDTEGGTVTASVTVNVSGGAVTPSGGSLPAGY